MVLLVPVAGFLHNDALPDPSPAQFALFLVSATLPISYLPQDKKKYEKLQLSLPTVSAKLAYPGIRVVVLICERYLYQGHE